MASGEEDGEKKKSGMVGFMFGNVDKRGKLDEDYLEEEAKENLDALDGRIDIAEEKAAGTKTKKSAAGVAASPASSNFHVTAPLVRARDREEELDEDEDYDEPEPVALPSSSVEPLAPATKAAETKPPSSAAITASATTTTTQAKDPEKKLKKKKSVLGGSRHLAQTQQKQKRRPLPQQSWHEDDLEQLKKVEDVVVTDARETAALEQQRSWRQDRFRKEGRGKLSFSLEDEEGLLENERRGDEMQVDGDVGSRFRAAVPLIEALKRGKQGEKHVSILLSPSSVMHNFHPVLNQDWEKSIHWCESDDDEKRNGGEEFSNPRDRVILTYASQVEPLRSEDVAAKVDEIGEGDHQEDAGNGVGMSLDAEDQTNQKKGQEKPKAQALKPILFSKLEGNEWVDQIAWDSDMDEGTEAVELDLDDKCMIFEIVEPDLCDVPLMKSNQSIILEKGNQSKKKGKSLNHNLDLKLLSNDSYYADNKKHSLRNSKNSKEQKARHSLPTLRMLTLRLTETMSVQELKYLHRPKGSFVPPKKKNENKAPALKFGGSYHVNARIRSLVGFDYSIPNPFVANATTIDDLWMTAKQLQPRLQRTFKDERPRLMLSNVKKPVKPRSLLGEGDNGLNLKGDATIWMVTNKITLIKNANYKRFQEPFRPPGAFKSMRDLSIRDGHLFLLEYVEEHPLLLSNQGMGLRLLSFYRKQNEEDDVWKDLRVEKVESPRDGSWGKYGRVIPLENSDDPPFLGDVMKGQHQLGVDCNLFRAPAFYHPVQSTDFLLVRSNLGRWMIREFSSNIVVGQQEPRVKTPWPGSVQIREFEETRFQDYVFRSLRKKIKDQAAGSDVLPELLVQDLKYLFPNNSEQLIRNRLRGLCNCVPVNQTQADGRWSLKPGARIPEEVELRHRLTPEMVCAYESMRSSQERYAAMGIKRHELLRVSNERLKLATELLPDGEEAKEAARFIEQMIQVASWAMITNYLDVMKEGRGTFNVSGLGDPSGRGRCVSFVKAPARGGEKESKKPNIIAGTKTDLRRLSMKKAEQILKTLGVQEDEIKLLTRWNRINLIQRLSTAAAADGSKLGDKYGGFARTHRQSAAESQRVYQSKCQDVFNKQVLALSEVQDDGPAEMEVDEEKEEEADDLANELENMLEDDDDDEEEKGKTEAELLAEDEEEMRRLKEEGLFGEKKKDKQPKEKEKPKETGPKRRLRRIFKLVNTDGTIDTKEVVITDPHQIETLRLARANYGGFGEGGMINLTKERKKLQDRHLKLKKRIMKQKKQLELMKDVGKKMDLSPAKVSGTKFKLKGLKVSTAGPSSKVKVRRAPKKRKLSPSQKLNRLIKEKIHMPIRNMPISKPFAIKLDLTKIRDYGDFVKEAITLGDISKKLHKNYYPSWMGYQADITKLVENAKAYNDPETGGKHKNPTLIQQAEFLQILINLRIARYAGEIIEAQERCEPLLIALRSKYNDELPWVECTKCHKWRMISFEQHQDIQAKAAEGGEVPWHCTQNTEREDPDCSDQDDEELFNNLKNRYLVQ